MTRGSGGAGDGLSRNRIPLPAWDPNRPGLHPSWQGFLTEIWNWISNQMSLTTLTSLRNIGHYHDHQFESVHNICHYLLGGTCSALEKVNRAV
jgi:hypothetical protein